MIKALFLIYTGLFMGYKINIYLLQKLPLLIGMKLIWHMGRILATFVCLSLCLSLLQSYNMYSEADLVDTSVPGLLEELLSSNFVYLHFHPRLTPKPIENFVTNLSFLVFRHCTILVQPTLRLHLRGTGTLGRLSAIFAHFLQLPV